MKGGKWFRQGGGFAQLTRSGAAPGDTGLVFVLGSPPGAREGTERVASQSLGDPLPGQSSQRILHRPGDPPSSSVALVTAGSFFKKTYALRPKGWYFHQRAGRSKFTWFYFPQLCALPAAALVAALVQPRLRCRRVGCSCGRTCRT